MSSGVNVSHLKSLLERHQNAPKEFQSTPYWTGYDKDLIEVTKSMDLEYMRSGRYPILTALAFNDVRYNYHPCVPLPKRMILKGINDFLEKFFLKKERPLLPYGTTATSIREMAFRHCELMTPLHNAKPISDIEVSDFGKPQDLFTVNGRQYTVQFLNYYIRYCFAQKHISFKGDETVVELGTGSGYQVETLKKLYPDLTILCFDLPTQVVLCQAYLSRALSDYPFIGTEETLDWNDLSGVKKGGVHFFGNWQFPLLEEFKFDLFWNAASFGEMEPHIVENYLKYVKGNAEWVYLLQARSGQGTEGKSHVRQPITLDDYKAMLSEYSLQEEHDGWLSHMRFIAAGGYFEAIWKRRD